jgi:hypothetical protein
MNSLYSNVTGNSNTAIGQNALFANTNDNNTAIGYAVLQSNTSGAYNVGVGSSALQSNTTGSYNYALGYQALASTTTASSNCAFGYQSLYASTGNSNTAMGHASLQGNTSGSNSVAIGHLAGTAATTGGDNTFVGKSAGAGLTTGSNCIYVGNASNSTTSVTYEIVIGNGTTGKGGSTGFISPAGGGMYQGNNTATWSVISDQRLKKNIVTNTIGLESINSIRVCNFEYRTKDEITELPKNQAIDKQGVQIGAIAQELQQILPDCVKEQTTGVLSVNTDNMIWHMINAIKELSAEVNALKAKVGT